MLALTMTARKFTDEQEATICARYQAGESTKELGEAYAVSDTTISVILKRNNVKARSNKQVNGGLTDQQEATVCARYQAGESTVVLGISYSITPQTVCRILQRNNVKARSAKEAKGGLTDEQEAAVCARYQAGENTHELGKAYAVGQTTICRILKRNKINTRSNKEANGGLTDEQEATVCARYQAGGSTVELGEIYSVSSVTISAILRRNNVKARSAKEAKGGLTDEQEAAVCTRYQAGENTHELGKAYAVSPSTICTILQRNNVKTRSPKVGRGGLTDEQEAAVCTRYQAGENTHELGKAYAVGPSTISRILQRNNVEARVPDCFGDTVQHALDSTGRHSRPRECEFYLYELARYSDTHCKPGISFDTDDRADDEYGAEVLRLFFDTRAEAYFLEQAVLDATRGYSDCPDDLAEWAGASEVRAMPAEDLLPVIDRLAAELELMGVWNFAAAYVPMTDAQRAACMLRGDQELTVA